MKPLSREIAEALAQDEEWLKEWHVARATKIIHAVIEQRSDQIVDDIWALRGRGPGRWGWVNKPELARVIKRRLIDPAEDGG